MQVIYSCLVIAMFLMGAVFGYIIGKNGFIQIGSGAVAEAEKEDKKTVEQQWADLMRYDGTVVKQGKDK